MKLGEIKGKIREAQSRMLDTWAIEPSAFEMIKGHYADFSKEPSAFLGGLFEANPEPILTTEGNTAFIEIAGPLVDTHDCSTVFFGCCSYEEIIKAIDEVGEMESIDKIVFNVSSPGGMVTGCDLCSQAIKAIEIPTEARVADMAASAAYWLISQCDSIVGTSLTACFGSIGVIIEYWDDTRARNNAGLDKITIVSQGAPDKRLDAINKDDARKIKSRLTDIEEIFVRRVAQGRGIGKEMVYASFGQGGVLLSEKAEKVGMIDTIEIISDNIEKQTNNSFSAEENMDLKEFLAQDEKSQKEFDSAVSTAVEKSLKESAAAVVKTEDKPEEKNVAAIEKASKILTSDYSKAVKEVALSVVKGEASAETLDAVLTVADSGKELDASAAALEETEIQGDLASQELPKVKQDLEGKISDEESYKASVNKLKNLS